MKKYTYIFLFLVACMIACHAQSKKKIADWPNQGDTIYYKAEYNSGWIFSDTLPHRVDSVFYSKRYGQTDTFLWLDGQTDCCVANTKMNIILFEKIKPLNP